MEATSPPCSLTTRTSSLGWTWWMAMMSGWEASPGQLTIGLGPMTQNGATPSGRWESSRKFKSAKNYKIICEAKKLNSIFQKHFTITFSRQERPRTKVTSTLRPGGSLEKVQQITKLILKMLRTYKWIAGSAPDELSFVCKIPWIFFEWCFVSLLFSLIVL